MPLIWEPSFCFKSPIALGYTRGHFTALVPFEKSEVITYMAYDNNSNTNGNNSEYDCNDNDLEKGNGDGACKNNDMNIKSNSANNNANTNSNSNNKTTNSNDSINANTNNTNHHNNNGNPTLLGAVSSSSSSTSSTNNNFDGGSSDDGHNHQTFYLPLANNEGHLLPVHFLTSTELGRERTILKQYLNLDYIVMPGSNCGLLVAQQRVAKRAMLVSRMLEEWLSYYKNMQAKEFGRQIELSQETMLMASTECTSLEQQQMMVVAGGAGCGGTNNSGGDNDDDGVEFNFNSIENGNASISCLQPSQVEEEEDEEEDEEIDSGDEDDDDDDDEDSPDDNESEEDYDDDEYADEVEVQ